MIDLPEDPGFPDDHVDYGSVIPWKLAVIDEAFDVWRAPKLPYDYHRHFDDWWQRDLDAMILRDRNHPCIIIYSIGNEINEQHQNRGEYPTQGGDIAKRLVEICKQHDPTRPVTAACNHRGSAEKAGINDYLLKPATAEKIREILLRTFSKSL